MKRRLLPLLLAGAAAVLPPAARAYECLTSSQGVELKWAPGETVFFINPEGGPTGSTAAIQLAMETWNAGGGVFGFRDAGFTTLGRNSSDGLNVGCFGALGNNGILAQNRLLFRPVSGHLLDSDIIFNTAYAWSTDGTPDTYDVGNIATHEWGHSVGLADLYEEADSEKTMYGYGGVEEIGKKTLEADDIAGLIHLYPEPGTLRATLSPAAAVSAGAQWSIDVGDWMDDGTALSVTPGLYPVSFRPLDGFAAPAGQVVTVTSGKSAALNETYTPLSNGQIGLQESYCEVNEGTPLSVVVNRINGSSGAASVNYITKPKNASPWTDYSPRSGRLVWEDGDESPKTVRIPISRDREAEGNERFVFILQNPQGATLANPKRLKVLIVPNVKGDRVDWKD